MTMRDLTPRPRRPALSISPEDYRAISADLDERRLGHAFVGVAATRQAFGEQLLAETSAEADLAHRVPAWLRPYVQLDGARYLSDLEAHGVYVVRDYSQGVCVFDGLALGVVIDGESVPRFPEPGELATAGAS